MKNFIFIKGINDIEMQDGFKGVMPLGISSIFELMNAVATVMDFPVYFGHNWNALFDCMTDFNWIKEKSVFLIHAEVPALEFDDLTMYIDILMDAVQDWKEGEQHEFFVIFPSSVKTEILNLLK
jgi:hypothetical protein